MRIVNTSPVRSYVAVAIREDGTRHVGFFAKATFTFDARGGLSELIADGAEPVRIADEETEAGVFCRDDLLSEDGGFEVFFYGSAHAPTERWVSELEVALAVDDTRRTLRVFGERTWTGELPSKSASAPAPFHTMPIAPRSTFGGSWAIEVDEGATAPFADSRNPHGKGFVVAAGAQALSEHLGAEPGYPKLPLTYALANVEHPSEPVRSSDDLPRAAHWGAHPLDYFPSDPATLSFTNPPKVDLRRAHPDWRLPQRADTPRIVVLEHLSADGPRVEVELPRGRVAVDVLRGERVASVLLSPRRMMVMPEERRISVLFAGAAVVKSCTEDRAARFRWEGASR